MSEVGKSVAARYEIGEGLLVILRAPVWPRLLTFVRGIFMVASLGLAIGVSPFSGSGWKPSFEKRFCVISNVGWQGKGQKSVNRPRVEERVSWQHRRIEYCPSQ